MKSDKTVSSSNKKAKIAPRSEPVKRNKKPTAAAHKHSKGLAQSAPVASPVAAAVDAKPDATAKPLDHEAVARLAHSFWVERNYAHGFAEEDWHRAVKVLTASA